MRDDETPDELGDEQVEAGDETTLTDAARAALHLDQGALDARIAEATALLEAVAFDRALLARIDQPARVAFLKAAGQTVSPDKKQLRKLRRALHRREVVEKRAANEVVRDETGIRALRREGAFVTPAPLVFPDTATVFAASVDSPAERELSDAVKCYVCKQPYTRIHHFYDQLCPECADLNWRKRQQTADLRGRTALVSGARVKIGYQAAIMLLRSGARVIVLTRFPRDAAQRYAREADYGDWGDRLSIFGIDLRHTPSVLELCDHLVTAFDRLDYVLNNACQTVRRPSGFYHHLMEGEQVDFRALPASVRKPLERWETLRAAHPPSSGSALVADADGRGLVDSAGMTQLALLEEDRVRGGAIFPHGMLDQDLQQVDMRDRNSWRLTMAEVPAVELLEVQLVNAVAPFLLNARLKPLMMRTDNRDKHIVNVSAVEGQFYRSHKTDRHPHTNMAKAALNMMTRTSAPDYVKDGIHMNAVDTGWVTDEDPVHITQRKRSEHGFHPPLDIVDGAARIVDPIFDGANTGAHAWGKFFKDYKETWW